MYTKCQESFEHLIRLPLHIQKNSSSCLSTRQLHPSSFRFHRPTPLFLSVYSVVIIPPVIIILLGTQHRKIFATAVCIGCVSPERLLDCINVISIIFCFEISLNIFCFNKTCVCNFTILPLPFFSSSTSACVCVSSLVCFLFCLCYHSFFSL